MSCFWILHKVIQTKFGQSNDWLKQGHLLCWIRKYKNGEKWILLSRGRYWSYSNIHGSCLIHLHNINKLVGFAKTGSFVFPQGVLFTQLVRGLMIPGSSVNFRQCIIHRDKNLGVIKIIRTLVQYSTDREKIKENKAILGKIPPF